MMIRTSLILLLLASAVLPSGGLTTLEVTAMPQAADGPGVVDLTEGVPTELRVRAGRSILISSQQTVQRVSVTNPDVASAAIITPTQILIHGQRVGAVTLILWDELDRAQAYNLVVDMDVEGARAAIQRLFPDESVEVFQSGDSMVLTGSVSEDSIAEQAGLLAGTMGGQVVNLLATTENRQVVMLQVKFAEVDRNTIDQFGLSLFSTGAANTVFATSTQQFGDVGAGGGTSSSTGRVTGSDASFTLGDLLNVFIFRPDLDLGATIRAMEQTSSLQILAEPNVLALNGREASFLAGGEFPFPVVQGGTTNSVSIQFKEFGVRLNFTPNILPDGTIRLRVTPEVSALDFANALTVSGFLVPALSTRRADTEVELRDGQTFAIAGLMDNRLTEAALKVPILGDIPILGHLFRSYGQNESQTELLVMVTPRLVEAMDPSQVPPGPNFPIPFMTPEEFDGDTGEAPAENSGLIEPVPAVIDTQRTNL